jgi:hypothetical protein
MSEKPLKKSKLRLDERDAVPGQIRLGDLEQELEKCPFQIARHYQFGPQESLWVASWASLPLESATMERITINN